MWKPPPNRVFVKILQQHKDAIFSKMNVRNDGSISELFTEIELESNFEASFAQNVHIGEVLNVGGAVKNIKVGDIAIIDYLVDNADEIIIGYEDGNKIVSVIGITEYYDHSQESSNERRLLYADGDYKEISQIYGVVSNGNLVAIDPFIFVETKDAIQTMITESGIEYEEEFKISKRKVIASYEGAFADVNNVLVLKEWDIFDRTINGKKVSIIFNEDIKLKSQ